MKTHYSFEQYQDLIAQLARQIHTHHKGQLPYDQILCLARGGMVVGDAFSRIFKLPLAVLFTSSYKINQERGELFIDNQIAKQNNRLGHNILLVDDLVDSGLTLQGVVDNLYTNYHPTLLDTAVIWKKEHSVFMPNFHVLNSPSDEWLVQPFENFDEFEF